MSLPASQTEPENLNERYERQDIARKKARALGNYARARGAPPKERESLRVLQLVADKKFLDEDDTEYLNKKVAKMEIEWSHMAYKTKKMSQYMVEEPHSKSRRIQVQKKNDQIEMNFCTFIEAPSVSSTYLPLDMFHKSSQKELRA